MSIGASQQGAGSWDSYGGAANAQNIAMMNPELQPLPNDPVSLLKKICTYLAKLCGEYVTPKVFISRGRVLGLAGTIGVSGDSDEDINSQGGLIHRIVVQAISGTIDVYIGPNGTIPTNPNFRVDSTMGPFVIPLPGVPAAIAIVNPSALVTAQYGLLATSAAG